MRVARKPCVIARRAWRKTMPVVHKTGRFVERHVIRTSVASFVPSVVNDTLVHHVRVTPEQLIHVMTDDVTVSSMTALALILVKLGPLSKRD